MISKTGAEDALDKITRITPSMRELVTSPTVAAVARRSSGSGGPCVR